jgi:hypothetical protein
VPAVEVLIGDLEDFEQNHSGDWPTLEELVTRGLAREVQEECCVAPKDTRHMVLALTLDLQLGMKPDFFGVSFINENWQALEKRREPLYGGPLDAQDVDLLTVERFQKSIDRIASQWAGQKSAFLMANLVFLRSNYSQINELRNSLLLECDDP